MTSSLNADRLELDRFHFCGLSMGGMTGMWLPANAPQGLNKVAISSASAKFGTPKTWSTRIETVRKQGMKPVAAATIERWFTCAFRAKNPSHVANIRKMVESVNPEGYIACCAAVLDFDFREQRAVATFLVQNVGSVLRHVRVRERVRRVT